MKRRLTSAAVATAVLITLMVSAQEQSKPVGAQATTGASAEDKSNKTRGGPDENIKVGEDQAAKNDPAKEPPAPPDKGGAKTRGYLDCWVSVNNYTPWWVDVYVDGTYRGQASPWGAGVVNAGSGGTALYAAATFTDGSVRSWGPRRFLCSPDGRFSWRLDR